MISLDSLDEVVGGSEVRAREHFKRALDLQKDRPQAGPTSPWHLASRSRSKTAKSSKGC